MSSVSQETRACLDDSLILPFQSWENLKAAKAIDVKEVVNQIRAAAEAAEKLRSFVSSELPGASWKSRQELDTILETIEKEIYARALRSQLVNLSAELERGRLVHRRAARVEQLNQFRNAAIKELRTKAAAKGAPAQLPGPFADQWIDWACALEEPADGQPLGILRNSFPALDAFVSHLEPGMWQVEGAPEAAVSRPEKAQVDDVQKDMRQRLLSLAAELERGSIVHHRAVRVSQLNQLRDEAVNELRARSKGAGKPSPLPGPVVSQWVEWACSLKEPDDAEAIETIRTGFPSVDDFVAHLEPNMWVPGAANANLPTDTPSSRHSEPAGASAAARGSSSSSAPVSTPSAPHIEAPPLLVDEDDENSFADRVREKTKSVTGWFHGLKGRGKSASGENGSAKSNGSAANFSSKISENLRGKQAIILAVIVVALLATLGMGWRSHRMHATNIVQAEGPVASVPDSQAAEPNSTSAVNSQGTAAPQDVSLKTSTNAPVSPNTPAENSGSQSDNSKTSKQKTDAAPSTAADTKKAAQLNDGQLRTPAPIPKAGKGSSATPPETAPDMLALAGSSNANRMFADVVSAPAARPKFSGQKERVSSGVTQGLLLQSVKPVYPAQAQQAHVTGTVVLNAVIGKDGSVQTVKVVSGHPMLTQAAVDAVKRWHYKPYYLNGEAVEAETQIKINFAPQ